MSQEVADLYIKLRTNARQLVPDFTAAGNAGERMVSNIKTSGDRLDRAYAEAAVAAQTAANRTQQAMDRMVASYQRAGTGATQLAARVKTAMASISKSEKGAADAISDLESRLRKSVDALVVSHERTAKSQLRLESVSAQTAAKVAAAQDKVAASAATTQAKVAAASARIAESDGRVASSAAATAAKVAAANDRIVESQHRRLATEAQMIARVEQASSATTIAHNRAAASHLLLEQRTAQSAAGISQANEKAMRAGVDLEKQIRRQVEKQIEAEDYIVRSHGMVSRSIEETSLKQRSEYERMAAHTAKLSSAFEDQARRASAANDQMAESIDNATNRTIKSTEGRKEALADAALAITVIAGASAGIAVQMAGDFELGTTRLVTSAGELRSNLDMVRTGLLRMSSEVGYKTSELIEALIRVNSAGYHGAEGLDILRSAAQGAKAENADLVTVADAVTSVLADYRYMNYSAADVTSKLVVATSQGKTTMEELASSLSAVLPIASSAKIKFEDIVGAQASMTVHGMSARQSAQNLADAIRHMLAPTQVQAKELGQLGLSAQDLAGMLSERGLTGTLNHLVETILSKMGPSGKVMLDAFNQSKDAAGAVNDMIKAMPKPVSDLAIAYRDGTISLGDYKKGMNALPADQAGLAKQFMSLSDRASGFTELLKQGTPAAQSFQDALRRVMGDATGLNVALMLTGNNTEYTTEAVRSITAATADASGNVLGWSSIQNTFNQKLAETVSGVESLATKIGMAMLPAFSKGIDLVSRFVGWLLEHEGAAKAAAVAIGVGLVVALSLATAAAWNFAAAMWATGVPEIILAITAIAAAIYFVIDGFDLWERAIKPFFGWLREQFAQLKAVLQPFLDVVREEGGKAWRAFVDEALKYLPEFKESIASVSDQAQKTLGGLYSWLKENGPEIKEGIREAFRIFREYVIPTLFAVAEKVSDFLLALFFFVRAAIKVIKYFGEMFGEIFEGIQNFAEGLVKFLKGTFTGDWEMAWDGLKQIVQGFFGPVLAIAKFSLKSLTAVFEGFGKGVAAIFGVDLDRVGAKITNTFIDVGQKAGDAIEALGLEVPEHIKMMDRLTQIQLNSFKNNFGRVMGGVKEAGEYPYVGLVESIKEKLGLLSDATSDTLGFIGDMFGLHFGIAKTDSELALNSFRESSSGIMGQLAAQLGIDLEAIKNKFTEKFSESKDSGQQLIQGLKEEVGRLLRSMAEALGIDLDAIVSVFRAKFGGLKGDSEIAMESFRESTVDVMSQVKNALTGDLEAVRQAAEDKLAASRAAAEREMGRTVVVSSDTGGALRRIFGEAWEAVRSGTVAKVGDMLGWLQNVPGWIGGIFSGSSGSLWGHGNATMASFYAGLEYQWRRVQALIRSIAPWIGANKGPISYDRTLLTPAGNAIMAGLLAALQAGGERVRRFVREFTEEIASSSAGSLAGTITVTGVPPGPPDDGRGSGFGGRGPFVPSPPGGGAPQQVINVEVKVAGSVIAERDLQTTVQQTVLRYAGRNNNNGLSPTFGSGR